MTQFLGKTKSVRSKTNIKWGCKEKKTIRLEFEMCKKSQNKLIKTEKDKKGGKTFGQ